MSDHIPFSQLASIAEGRSAFGDQIGVREHLSTCPVCAAELAWLERVIGLMRADTIEPTPAHAVASAKRLFRPPARPAARQHLMAALQFDSARAPVALGRRAQGQFERQMLFAVSSYLLDLRVVPQGAMWVVSGQLLGAEDGRQVELDGPAGTSRVELNDLSEFVLPPSPSGIYTLRVQLTDIDITIAGLEVGR